MRERERGNVENSCTCEGVVAVNEIGHLYLTRKIKTLDFEETSRQLRVCLNKLGKK